MTVPGIIDAPSYHILGGRAYREVEEYGYIRNPAA